MSIVSKYSKNFKHFQKLTGLKPINLNKVSSKYVWHYTYSKSYETKGVDSDFIRIYKIDQNNSVAFAFNYKNLDEPHVIVSIKTGDNIDYSKHSENGFKAKFSTMMSVLKVLNKTNGINTKSLKESVNSVFINNSDINVDKEYDDLLKEAKKEVSKKKRKYEKNLKELALVEDELKTIKNLILKKKEQFNKKYNIEELEKKLRDARKKQKTAVANLEEKLELGKIKVKKRDLERKVYSMNSEIRKAVDDVCGNKITKKMKKKMEEELSK